MIQEMKRSITVLEEYNRFYQVMFIKLSSFLFLGDDVAKEDRGEYLQQNEKDNVAINAKDVKMKRSSVDNSYDHYSDSSNTNELPLESESSQRSSITTSNSWEAFPGAGEVAEPTGRYENLKVILQRKRKRRM